MFLCFSCWNIESGAKDRSDFYLDVCKKTAQPPKGGQQPKLFDGVSLFISVWLWLKVNTNRICCCVFALSPVKRHHSYWGLLCFSKTVNSEINKCVEQKCFKSCNILNNHSSISFSFFWSHTQTKLKEQSPDKLFSLGMQAAVSEKSDVFLQ